MSEIERRLDEIDVAALFPATPDLADAAMARVADSRTTAWAPRRTPAVRRLRAAAMLLVVVAAAATGVLVASPGARSAISDLFGLRGATIEHGDPSAARRTPPPLGRPVSLREARRLTGFELAMPAWLGRPSSVGIDRSVPEEPIVSLAWQHGGQDGARLVLSQMRATATPRVSKTAPDGTRVESVEVHGRPGYWLAGAAHGVELRGPQTGALPGGARLAGETLLWEHDGLLLRLEGAGSKSRALQIARSIR